ncbi:hypothetical protein LJR030_001734 [Rhizobium sp. LjRoot30]|uniref:hypothetical protein n=1 Tax=Rhizobium sp. LjRoot30 TaxID=3342320 RepID=UPI003ED0515A
MILSKIKITEKFDPQDISCSPSILIENDPPEIIKIIRILSGTAHLRNDATDEIIYGGDRNFINPGDDISSADMDRVLEYIFEVKPEEAEISSIFRKASILNRGFYRDILSELLYLMKSLNKENYTETFLYTYRILERISAACPLIYVSGERDFRSAYSFLSSIYDDKKSPSELVMLKKFLQHYASQNDNFSQATLDFELSGLENEFATDLVSEFRTIILPEVSTMVIDEANGKITIPFKDVGHFVATVRNRTFHNQGLQANINLPRIGGSEPLFALLVPVLLYWFSYVFVDFAKWQLSKAS